MLTATAAAVALLAGSTAWGNAVEPARNEIQLVATDDPDRPFVFDPAELTVEAGTTVSWRNMTADVFHTVTFTDSLQQRQDNGVFNESLFAEGDVVEFTFDEPGTFNYFCQPHSEFMGGTVIVTAPSSPSTAWRWWVAWGAGSLVLVGLAVITFRRSRRTVTLDEPGPAA